MIEALPPLLAAEPLQGHFQVKPGNEILEGFWLKLTPMASSPEGRMRIPQESTTVFYSIENPYQHKAVFCRVRNFEAQ
jgi:hypothetical protein